MTMFLEKSIMLNCIKHEFPQSQMFVQIANSLLKVVLCKSVINGGDNF